MAADRGNQSIQFCFSYGPYMIAFSWKLSWVKNPNMTVNLFTENFLWTYDYEPIRDITQEGVAHVLQGEVSLKTSN